MPTFKRSCFHVSVCCKVFFPTKKRVLPAWLPRFPLPRRLTVAFLSIIVVTIILIILHFSILPSSMGYYNEDCNMQEAKRERMRFVLRHVVTFLNNENATYWLDFGTLLGVIREGDIIAHDGDLDVSRLADDLQSDSQMMVRFEERMRAVGIEGNAMIARYQDVQVDMFRWQTIEPSSGKHLLQKYYPFVNRVGFAGAISDFLFPTEVPVAIVFPLREISVFGLLAKIPHRTLEFLKIRYPLTWYTNFPYKWKCWAKRL